MPRQFGPTLGAGTQVTEKDAGRQITPAATGTTVYIGQMEKGMRLDDNSNLDINDCPTLRSFLRKCGTYFEGSELPDNALDFLRFSDGSGRLYTVRVTDGNEVDSQDHVWGRGALLGDDYVERATAAARRLPLLTVTAKNGGRWGGAQATRYGNFTTGSDLTETTLDTSQAMLEDEWAGATLELLGVTTKTYKVISNTTTGVLTVETGSTMATDLAADTPATETYTLTLDTETREFSAVGSRSGDRKALSLVWKDGEESTTAYFGLDVYVDEELVRSYPNLSLDSSNKWYIGTIVGEDVDNDFIDVVVDHAGAINAANRPANWYGEYKGFSSKTLTAKVWNANYTLTNDLAGFVSNVELPTKCVRQRLTITFSDATNFTVTSDADYGLELESGLISGAVGTAVSSPNDYVAGFTIQAGSEDFAASDTIVIDITPFPVDLETGDGLLEGNVYVDAGSSSVRVAIDDNTVDTIVLKAAPASAPTAATSLEADADTVDIGTAITFPTSSIAIDIDIVTDDDGYENITIGSAAYATIGDLVTALNGAVSNIPAFFAEGTADTLAINKSLYTTSAANDNVGKDSFIHVISSADAETNITDDVKYTGGQGDEFRVEAPTELFGGYDGADPADSDYIDALNTALSPINRLRGRNVGLVKIACPGVTSTAVQRAGLAYAAARNYQYRVEIPSNIVSEPSAVAYINDTIGRNDYGVAALPSYGYVQNPKGDGVVLQSLTGAIHGREAAVARDFQGYHKAAAGQDVTIPHLVKTPIGDAVLNEEILNPQGLQVIKKLKGNFVIWGARSIALDPAWKWKHQREYMSHIENILLESYDWLIFAINDPTTQRGVITTLRAFFYPEWQKRALRGATFEEACGLKIDGENNTNATRAAGDLNADISLRLADTVERFRISIGKLGIFDQIG